MPELPPAARQLITQVTNHDPDAEATANGEVDGFGVTRSVTFDAKTSKWLSPILEVLADERIREISHKGRKLTVTFVGSALADHADPFEVEAAEQALHDHEDG